MLSRQKCRGSRHQILLLSNISFFDQSWFCLGNEKTKLSFKGILELSPLKSHASYSMIMRHSSEQKENSYVNIALEDLFLELYMSNIYQCFYHLKQRLIHVVAYFVLKSRELLLTSVTFKPLSSRTSGSDTKFQHNMQSCFNIVCV